MKPHTTRRLTFGKPDELVEPTPLHDYEFRLAQEDIRGKAVLDLGRWNGKFLSLAATVSPKRLVGVDLEPRALQVGREHVAGAEFIQGSIYNLPFAEGSFNTVVLWGVIEHLPVGAEPAALTEINRVLSPGGKLFLMTPSSNLLSKVMDPAYWLAGHRHYSKRAITGLLERTRFSVADVHGKGGFFEAVETDIYYVYKHVLRRDKPPKFLRRWVEAEFSRKGKWGFNTMFVEARKVADVGA